MKSFAIKTSTIFLIVLLSALFCIGLGYAETEKPFTISVINNTDVIMIQNTYWINHEIPDYRGPFSICVAELQPGANQTFNFGIAATKGRIFVTRWSMCRPQNEEDRDKYRYDLLSKIPTDTTIVKIYHKHFEIVTE